MMIATRQQITMIALAVLAVMSLRFLAGPFPLQGVLYVLVTGVVTWRIGVRAGLMSAVLGVIAAHLQRVIVDPGVLMTPCASSTGNTPSATAPTCFSRRSPS